MAAIIFTRTILTDNFIRVYMALKTETPGDPTFPQQLRGL